MKKLIILFALLPLIGFSQLRFESGLTWDNLETLYVITYDDYKGRGKGNIIYRDKAFIDSALYVLDHGNRYPFKDGLIAKFSEEKIYINHREMVTLISREELETIKANQDK